MAENPLEYNPQEPQMPPPNERTWAALTHLMAMSIFLTGVGMVVGPLVMWMIKKDEMPFVDMEGKEALNFNISWAIWMIISAALMIVLIGFILLPLVSIAWFILVIVASVKASNGEHYRYPLTMRLIR